MKSIRMFVTGLIVGALLATAGSALAASETVQATVAKFRFLVNGEERELRTDPIVVKGTTYLPVREVANMLGYDVVYRSDSKTVEFYAAPKEPIQNEIQPKGDEQELISEKTKMTGRELVELLAKKYPQYVADATKPQILLAPDGTLKIGEDSYHVTFDVNGYVDVSPLIEAGVLSDDDIQ